MHEVPVHLDVAKWSKASGCKPGGASPRPFESDRRVHASLAQRTRAAGFYPAGRPFESVTRYQFNLGVAQMAARVIWDHEAAGSRPATETSRKRVLGCGRSSMAEPWAVNPLVPVRLRPVTPKPMPCNASRIRAAENRALAPDGQGSQAPFDAPLINPLVAELADAPVSETGARRACPFDSDRGDQLTEVR